MKKLLVAVAIVAALLTVASSAVLARDTDYQDGGATVNSGGQLITDDGQLVFAIPANAFDVAYFNTSTNDDGDSVSTPTDNIRVRYLPTGANNLPAKPDNTIWVGTPFSLQLMYWDSMAFLSLKTPATMIIHYRPEDLGGRSESSLRIVRWFDRWVPLASTVDTVNHTVTVQTPWGGEYGLVVDNVAAPAPAAPAPAPAPAAAPPAAPAVPMNSGITGKVFYDKNGNGAVDGDDFAIAGAKLRISSGSWSAETTSAADGSYAFWVLRESSYTVEVIVGPEWAYTTPNVVTGIAVNGQADSRGTANFGLWYRLP